MDGSAPIASITISYLMEQYSGATDAVTHGRRVNYGGKGETMRLIDAEKLLTDENYEKYLKDILIEGETGEMYIRPKDIADLIANAPTVDAVPIIRCKDCVNWKQLDTAYITHTDGTPVYSCPLYDDWGDEDGWCCYAERKDNETD